MYSSGFLASTTSASLIAATLRLVAIWNSPMDSLDGHVHPNMLAIALELASEIPSTKTSQQVLEHFLYIANA